MTKRNIIITAVLILLLLSCQKEDNLGDRVYILDYMPPQLDRVYANTTAVTLSVFSYTSGTMYTGSGADFVGYNVYMSTTASDLLQIGGPTWDIDSYGNLSNVPMMILPQYPFVTYKSGYHGAVITLFTNFAPGDYYFGVTCYGENNVWAEIMANDGLLESDLSEIIEVTIGTTVTMVLSNYNLSPGGAGIFYDGTTNRVAACGASVGAISNSLFYSVIDFGGTFVPVLMPGPGTSAYDFQTRSSVDIFEIQDIPTDGYSTNFLPVVLGQHYLVRYNDAGDYYYYKIRVDAISGTPSALNSDVIINLGIVYLSAPNKTRI